ncbi:MAG: alanine:cation symporter family protein [Kiritimatiellia bacterium]
MTYGFGPDNDVVCTPEEGGATNAFSVRLADGTLCRLHLDHNPGVHNCLNATAVLALAAFLGAGLELGTVFAFADICNALMCGPNLLCLAAMSGEVCRAIRGKAPKNL